VAVIWAQSALQKMQMRRRLSSAKLRFVLSEQDGLDWLFAETPPDAA